MPIAAVPAGVEIKKITPTQKKALDELLKKQKETSLLETLIPSLAFVGVSVAAGVGIWAYLNQESITDSVKGFAEGSGKIVADALLNVLPSPDTPLTPEVTAQGTELDICTRFEADYVAQNDLKNSIPIVGGTLQALGQLDTIKKMKKNGCSKPFVIPQSQWDQG
jgi:hypothetical protein